MHPAPRDLARTVTLAATLALVTACGGADDLPTTSPTESHSADMTTSPSDIETLPSGKDDLSLSAGRYRSPDGFYPRVVVTVGDGWTSVHRGADGFDLGRSSDPDGTLLVAVAFLVPTEATAAAALDAVRGRVTESPTSVAATVGGLPANGIDVDGGSGQLVAGASGGIALDAMPDGRVRVLAVEVNGAPLLVAVVVPDASRWDASWPDVEPILEGAEFA